MLSSYLYGQFHSEQVCGKQVVSPEGMWHDFWLQHFISKGEMMVLDVSTQRTRCHCHIEWDREETTAYVICERALIVSWVQWFNLDCRGRFVATLSSSSYKVGGFPRGSQIRYSQFTGRWPTFHVLFSPPSLGNVQFWTLYIIELWNLVDFETWSWSLLGFVQVSMCWLWSLTEIGLVYSVWGAKWWLH